MLRLLQCSKRIGNIYWSYIRGFARDPSYNIIGLTPILFLFLISGVLRLLFSITMLPQLREVRKVQPSRPLWYFMESFIRRRFHI